MTKLQAPLLLLAALTFCLLSSASARILTQCDAAKELARAGIERTFISTYVCIMKSESNFDTKKKTGPGHKASYSYGVFQISSDKWCNAFRPGGICNKKCDDFLDDDIKDDIACARIIAQQEGFKHWKGWVKSCKNGNLPNVSGCIIRRDVEEEQLMDEAEPALSDEEMLETHVPVSSMIIVHILPLHYLRYCLFILRFQPRPELIHLRVLYVFFVRKLELVHDYRMYQRYNSSVRKAIGIACCRVLHLSSVNKVHIEIRRKPRHSDVSSQNMNLMHLRDYSTK